MRVLSTCAHFLALAWAGCASVTGSDTDMGVGVPHDMAGQFVVDLANADLTLTCGIGFRLCTDHCVGPNECCLSSECTPPAQHGAATCTKGQCVISCDSGYMLCGGMCIPGQGACCSPGDCPTLNNVAVTTCMGAMCGVGTCKDGFYDLDNYYGNGCECADSGFAKSCPAATSLGTLATGGTTARTGTLPVAGVENWFAVIFAYTTLVSYHPHVTLTASAGESMIMDLYSNCSGSTLACGTEGTMSAATNDWEVAGGGAPASLMYQATPSVGTLYIKVRRASGAATCGTYTLTVLN